MIIKVPNFKSTLHAGTLRASQGSSLVEIMGSTVAGTRPSFAEVGSGTLHLKPRAHNSCVSFLTP